MPLALPGHGQAAVGADQRPRARAMLEPSFRGKEYTSADTHYASTYLCMNMLQYTDVHISYTHRVHAYTCAPAVQWHGHRETDGKMMILKA